MKILFITAFPPNQKTAGQDYTRRLICDLVAKKNSVKLIYANYPDHKIEIPDSVEILRVIQPSLKNCFKKLYFHPFFTKRFDFKTLQLIQSVAKSFDMIYFDFSQVHIYSLFVNHPCKVMMCHDIIFQKFSRKGFLQLPWIKKSECYLLKTANNIITFSKKDSDLLLKNYGITSSPVNFYIKNNNFGYKEINIEKNVFCFYGAWNRSENFEPLKKFCKRILPKISEKFSFRIIGGGIPKDFKDMLDEFPNVTVLGFVESPLEEIAKCEALVAPLQKGAGVKVKVIDALSTGTPVIGTNIAFEGIEDNIIFPLFNNICCENNLFDVFNNWKNITTEYKAKAMREFLARYEKNHFVDLLPELFRGSYNE